MPITILVTVADRPSGRHPDGSGDHRGVRSAAFSALAAWLRVDGERGASRPKMSAAPDRRL